ncbi:lysosomal L-cystine transporter [Viridothelium virens]|uniref:Lysosomal L-cystine transporter n=1 Tax=Viridothelium virens TaxID=1048519 RepID=A0A6A6H5T9_VIRVR|nr:lysosomal L-cystine transporter [Viridothelium virens]
MMSDDDLVRFARVVSFLLGWTYFFCWSISFYPQPLENWRRRSTAGVAVDWPLANLPAFAAYTISTSVFLYSPSIRSQYAFRHPQAPRPTVELNDLAFAAHAFMVSVIYYSQFWPSLWGFKSGSGRNATKPTLGVVWGSLFGAFIVALVILIKGRDFGNDAAGWAWIDEIYALSYVKLIITVVKYMPQIWLNYKDKSTVGWSIVQVMLDFIGAILSLLQLFIDSALEGDWSGVTGNPVKFMLGNLGVVFNIIFITQHCILYRHAKDIEIEGNTDEQRPLLGANGHTHNANS